MPSATGSPAAELEECDRGAVGGDAVAEYIRSDNGPEFVARQLRDWIQGLETSPLIYRTWQSMREWVLRELQWEAEGGMSEWGDRLLVEGGTDRDRAEAAAVQPGTRFQGLKGSCNMSHFTWYTFSARSASLIRYSGFMAVLDMTK